MFLVQFYEYSAKKNQGAVYPGKIFLRQFSKNGFLEPPHIKRAIII
jgi:hypothetical protein